MLKVMKKGAHLQFVERLHPVYDFREKKFYNYNLEYVVSSEFSEEQLQAE